MNRLFFLAVLLLTFSQSFAQDEPPKDWFHLDHIDNGFWGISSYKAYKDLIKNKKGKTVIVAVLDSGVDFKHEDLKDIMWTNPGEIAGNGIDDDHNGYIDDIHGWNFIGGKNGNVDASRLEVTRLYAHYDKIFKDVDSNNLSKKLKKEYAQYLIVKKDFEESLKNAQTGFERYKGLLDEIGAIQEKLNINEFTPADMDKLVPLSDTQKAIKQMLATSTVKQLRKRLSGGYDYFLNNVNYYYNVDFDARKIVGDDYANTYEKYYGNNDSKGPDSSHGTHVSGIIAATRNNGIGIDGVANNVRIMSIRAVPNGDETDKDVANGIIYAVDNGAKIINMSFGKPYSWDKKAVDKAVRYAEKHGVLLIHAAMNDSKNIDIKTVYPNDRYDKKKWFRPRHASNWLDVGAFSWKKGEDAVATFSNYGKTNVDVFAPGVAIYSTTPEDTYASYNGTSMATPVTAGVAAMIMSYYPNLSVKQVKEIIMESTIPVPQQVKRTDTHELAPMKDLCITGGVVNLYEALRLAAKY